MRPLAVLGALCALLLVACTSNGGPGPSSSLDLQPGVGGGARVLAGPQDGVGYPARVDVAKYGLLIGRAAEPPPAR